MPYRIKGPRLDSYEAHERDKRLEHHKNEVLGLLCPKRPNYEGFFI